MKKIVGLILCIFIILFCPTAFASEEGLDIVSECNEIKIVQYYGNGSPKLGATFWNCNYITTDETEIESIAYWINSLEETDASHRCADVSAICIYIDDVLTVSLHDSCGMCNINGRAYSFNHDEFKTFIDMIYDFKINKGITVSYYNSGNYGEIKHPLAPGYYTYFTTNKEEIKKIQECITNIDFIPFDGGFGTNAGESLNIRAGDERKISFFLRANFDDKWLCYYDEECYSFSIDDCRKLEELVFDYKSKDETKVYLNNTAIKFYNSPVIVNNRTLVPAAVMCDKLGIKAVWGGDCIVLSKDEKSLVIYNDRVYENKTFAPIDVGCQLIDDLAMIPIRKVAEFFGYEVKWQNNSVYIVSQ